MNIYFLSLITTLLFTSDSFTKLLAIVKFREQSYEIIPNILSLSYIQNPGIAFSIPFTWIILKITTVILIFGIILYYFYEERKKSSKLLDISFALIIGWALGNAWERINNAYVTDFISLEYFAVFNLADTYISLGALGVIIYYIKHK